MSITYFNNTSGSKQVNGLFSSAGGLEIASNVWFDPNSGSQLPENHDYVKLQQAVGHLIDLKNDGIVIKSMADLYIGSGQNTFRTTAGTEQTIVNKDKHDVVKGDHTRTTGEQSDKHIQAAKKLNDTTNKIDQDKIDHINNTKGEQVPCPVCSSEVLTDRGYCLLDEIVSIIRIAFPNFPYPLDIIQKILNFLGIPFLTPQKVQEVNGGSGCGSPGCKSGMVESPAKPVQEANQKAAETVKQQQNDIIQAQKDMGSGGTQTYGPSTGDVGFYVGHPEAINTAPTVAYNGYHTNVFGFTNKTTPQGLGYIPMTKGNCKKAIYSDPLINPGSLYVGVNQKLTVTVGSPGIDIHTTGKATLNAATTDIVATDGELMLRSQNLTTLKGKNVIIDAKDGSGDTGCRIEADYTMVGGLLSVQGDLAVKGHISMDGGITTTHITCPGERISSGPTGDAHQVHSSATWNNPETGLQASIYDEADKALKKLGRDLYNTLSLNVLNPSEIKTLVEETYHTIQLNTIVDNTAMPTGYSTAWFASPGAPVGSPLVVVGQAGPYPVLGYVIPGQTLPTYNFTHIHNSPGNNHSHDYTAPVSQCVANPTSATGARPEPSNVPTPPKKTGMGSSPGHKSAGDLCLPCINPFGGGNGNRNAAYGLGPTDEDVFQGTNYVQADPKFDDNGNLIPPPSIDLNC